MTKQSFYCIFSQSWSLSFRVIQLVERIYWRSIGIETLPIYVERSRRKTNYCIHIFSPCRPFFSLLKKKARKKIVSVHRTHTDTRIQFICSSVRHTQPAKWKHGRRSGTKKRTSSHTYFFYAYKRLCLLVSVYFSLSLPLLFFSLASLRF